MTDALVFEEDFEAVVEEGQQAVVIARARFQDSRNGAVADLAQGAQIKPQRI